MRGQEISLATTIGASARYPSVVGKRYRKSPKADAQGRDPRVALERCGYLCVAAPGGFEAQPFAECAAQRVPVCKLSDRGNHMNAHRRRRDARPDCERQNAIPVEFDPQLEGACLATHVALPKIVDLDLERARGKHKTPVFPAQRFIGRFFGRPKHPACAARLGGQADRIAFRRPLHPAVKPRVLRALEGLRLAEVDDIVPDHESACSISIKVAVI